MKPAGAGVQRGLPDELAARPWPVKIRSPPARAGRYRVIAMAAGWRPTLTGFPALLVAVRIGVTVPGP